MASSGKKKASSDWLPDSERELPASFQIVKPFTIKQLPISVLMLKAKTPAYQIVNPYSNMTSELPVTCQIVSLSAQG